RKVLRAPALGPHASIEVSEREIAQMIRDASREELAPFERLDRARKEKLLALEAVPFERREVGQPHRWRRRLLGRRLSFDGYGRIEPARGAIGRFRLRLDLDLRLDAKETPTHASPIGGDERLGRLVRVGRGR